MSNIERQLLFLNLEHEIERLSAHLDRANLLDIARIAEIERLTRINAQLCGNALNATVPALEAEIERLRANQERMWCKSCGTVTRDAECDCTIIGTTETQNLVNYADSRQEDINTLLAENAELLDALTDFVDNGPKITKGDVARNLKGRAVIAKAEGKSWCPFCKKDHAGGDKCMGHYP